MGAVQGQSGGFLLCGAWDDDNPVRFNYIGTPERMLGGSSENRDQEMTDMSASTRNRSRHQTPSDGVTIIQGIFQMGKSIVFVEYNPKDVDNVSSLHDGQCIICMDNPVDIKLKPCDHCICRKCWNRITEIQGPICPHCRGFIDTISTRSPSLTPMVTSIIFTHSKDSPQVDHDLEFPSRSRSRRTISRDVRKYKSHQKETEQILEDLDDSTSESEELGVPEQQPPQEHVPQQKRTSDINLRRLSKWFVKNKDAQGRGA